MKNSGFFRITGSAFAVFLLFFVCSAFSSNDLDKVSLAIFPFNSMNQNSLDMESYYVLHAALSGYGFIDIVPVEIIREKLYEIEPSFLWTGKRGPQKRGGILWKIEPKLVEKINTQTSARFSLYGDVTRFGNSWRIDAYLMETGGQGPGRHFSINGIRDEEMPEKLAALSKSVADLIRLEDVLRQAEADRRGYFGGMYSFEEAAGRLKNRLDVVPQSVPVYALLLDLYLTDREKFQAEVIGTGLRIINLLQEADQEDVRYLLSLNLDPFDAAAQVYEGRGEWEHAIDLRKRALEIFPFKPELHRAGLGRSYYFLAREYEDRGEKMQAAEQYGSALTYLQPSSRYFRNAEDALRTLQERQ